MTPDVVAVLVVPAPGDPGGLLREGVCGGIPASVTRPASARSLDLLRRNYPEHFGADDLERIGQWHRSSSSDNVEDMALPLLWGGVFVPEGWHRANEVLAERGDFPAPSWPSGSSPTVSWIDGPLMQLRPSREDVEHAASLLVRGGLASRIVRLARVDGRLVELEVTP